MACNVCYHFVTIKKRQQKRKVYIGARITQNGITMTASAYAAAPVPLQGRVGGNVPYRTTLSDGLVAAARKINPALTPERLREIYANTVNHYTSAKNYISTNLGDPVDSENASRLCLEEIAGARIIDPSRMREASLVFTGAYDTHKGAMGSAKNLMGDAYTRAMGERLLYQLFMLRVHLSLPQPDAAQARKAA